MKNFLLFTLMLPGLVFGMHHEKNPIIFYLDLDVAEGKSEGVEEFVDYLVNAVNETEPKTMYYKYWISSDKKKVSLMEMYHSNEDAIFHMNNTSPSKIPLLSKAFKFLEIQVMISRKPWRHILMIIGL